MGLFPVSVPFAPVLGFWPPALLCAQLMLPMLEDAFDLSLCTGAAADQEERRASSSLTVGERSEIFWRRRWPLVLALAALTGLIFWGGNQLLNRQEPDVQIAVVHPQPLPDTVIAALEESLAEQVGDLNGDGTALVAVNSYPVIFDGSAQDADVQTAGMVRLVTDLAAADSSLFAVSDAEGFLAGYGDKVDAQSAVLWRDCPILASLDGQDLLAEFTVFPIRAAEEEALALLGISE